MPRRTIPIIENENEIENKQTIQSCYSGNSIFIIFIVIIILVLFNGFDFF